MKNDSQEISLVKDTGSFFAEGFQPPFSQRPGSWTTTGIGRSSSSPGGKSSNPGSKGEGASCSPNPTPKFTPEVAHGVFNQGPKKKKVLNDLLVIQ